MSEEDTTKLLETLNTNTTKLLETLTTNTTKLLETLTTKIDELSKAVNEGKTVAEAQIEENPLAYVMGAFVGGLFVGLLMGYLGKGKEEKEGKQ